MDGGAGSDFGAAWSGIGGVGLGTMYHRCWQHSAGPCSVLVLTV